MRSDNNKLDQEKPSSGIDRSQLLDDDYPKSNKNCINLDRKITAANLFSSQINVVATELKPPITKSISCRQVLWYLAFVGFAVNYMIRINLNIAIVDMIQSKKITNNNGNVVVSECYNHTTEPMEFVNFSLTDGSHQQIQRSSGRFSFEREILKFLNVSILVYF